MSRGAEVIMHLLLSIVVVVGFAVVVVLGALSVVVDLLALTKHRPPSIFDELREDDQESEDRNRRSTSPDAVDAQASRTVATNINAAH
jgi:cytoskeletal protein RodZ